MREIKFRAWRKFDNTMLNDVGFHPHLSMDLAGEDEYYETNPDGRWLFAPMSDNIILMQFTGLKDKNGKEIYEGDILRLDAVYDRTLMPDGEVFPFHHKSIFKVFYDEDNAGFDLKLISSESGTDSWIFMKYSEEDFEIIGNIYQNPELLKDL